MSSFTYAENVNTNLLCCICRAPFVNPVTTKSCAHTFCLDCIQTALGITPQCPVDRSSLTVLDLRAANPLLRNLVDELLVECPNAALGCTETFQRQLVGIHVRNDCPHTTLRCSHPGCDRDVQRKDAGRHNETCHQPDVVRCPYCSEERPAKGFEAHRRACGREEVVCPSCDAVTIRSEVDAHTAVCPLTVIACSHSANGCPWEGFRHDFQEHIASCAYEAIKGFFTVHASKVSVLEHENAALKRKVDELEGTLRAVSEEAQAARRSLGPWFRTDASTSASPVTSPGAGGNPSQAARPEARLLRERRMSPLNAAMLGISTDAPFIPRAEAPADDSFFAPFSPGEDPADALPYGRMQASVPVVNINTSLEGSLTSLRNSVITISAALDAMGRRHDVALMTETLRMHEEVQSLRAIVHGLRMQVHQIMMERSQTSLSNLYASGQARASGDGAWSTRAEYLNDHAPSGPSMAVPLTTTVRRTAENKL